MKARLLAAVLAASLVAPLGGAGADWHLDAPGFSGDLRNFTLRQNPSPLMRYEALTPNGRVKIPEAFAGKVVLLNVWATWCPPCVEEMPSLDRLQARFGGDAFEVVALSLDQGGIDEVQRFFSAHGITSLAIYLDETPGQAFTHYRLAGLPTSFVIGPSGEILGTLGGPANWDSPEALALIDYFIDHARP